MPVYLSDGNVTVCTSYSGQVIRAPSNTSYVSGRNVAAITNGNTRFTANNYNTIFSVKSINGSWDCGTYTANNSLYFSYITDANFDAGTNATSMQVEFRGSDQSVRASKVYGAVWNDYAEYRETKSEIVAGRVVREVGDGTLELATERLMRGCEIVSDTYGFAIGETEHCQTPIAVSGRVLAYTDKPRETFEIGAPVCSGPNGTVSQMTEEEEMRYPSRIIGTVSEIPTYEEWGTGHVKVDGRIWIRIR